MKTIILSLMGLLLSIWSFAQSRPHETREPRTYALYSEGKMNTFYNQIIADLRAGDVVGFSNGRQFVLGPELGSGTTTKVFAIADAPEKALRLSLLNTTRSNMISYLHGYEALQENQISAVRVFADSSKEYILVERLQSYWTFKEFVEQETSLKRDGWLRKFIKVKETPENQELEEAKNKFYEFARQIHRFSHIGDMHRNNLIYDRHLHQWRLIDWTNNHSLATEIPAQRFFYKATTPFDSIRVSQKNPQGIERNYYAGLLVVYGLFNQGVFRADDNAHRWMEAWVQKAVEIIEDERERDRQNYNLHPACAGML